MNTKFIIRNLENEKRRIDKEIARLKKTTVIAEGTYSTTENMLLDVKADICLVSSPCDLDFNVRFEKYDTTIRCTMTTKDERFKDKKEFVGVARCDSSDTFNHGVGMTIAHHRAIMKVQKYILNEVSKY
ncbi:hypothetical protein [Romboutsia sp.]|uniref:hypothetical protein n=1 Tax=Romboutsia sp. TaxID=1965302 RepID=UPI002D1D2044|nr:hypothetical protein [Romboutsia sp.]HSQ88007.1 hypothetical protein [Romboutsia sp.]